MKTLCLFMCVCSGVCLCTRVYAKSEVDCGCFPYSLSTFFSEVRLLMNVKMTDLARLASQSNALGSHCLLPVLGLCAHKLLHLALDIEPRDPNYIRMIV